MTVLKKTKKKKKRKTKKKISTGQPVEVQFLDESAF